MAKEKVGFIGLGIMGKPMALNLIREALAGLHQNYLNCGLTCRDDQAEMQKMVPGWKFKAVRW